MQNMLDSLPRHEPHFHIAHFDVAEDVPPHTHDYIELAYVTEGSLYHHTGGHCEKVVPGDYVIIDHSLSHAYSCCGQPAVIINCIFQPAFLDPSLRCCRTFEDVLKSYLFSFRRQFQFRPYSGTVIRDETGEILRLLLQTEREYIHPGPASAELRRAFLTEISIYTIRQILPDALPASDDISYVQAAIRSRYMEPLRLEEFARELHMEPPSLSRKFTRACGYGFKEYLQRCRMEQACRLLAGTDRKVADIASACGYEDGKFFHQLFCRLQGMTPSAYRQQYRMGNAPIIISPGHIPQEKE